MLILGLCRTRDTQRGQSCPVYAGQLSLLFCPTIIAQDPVSAKVNLSY